jgi:hypothetical protein
MDGFVRSYSFGLSAPDNFRASRSPRNDAKRLNLDDWTDFKLHYIILPVFLPEERDCSIKFSSFSEKGGDAVDQHVLQPSPIFIVVVNDQANVRILNYIRDPAQGKGFRAFGLFIECTINHGAVERETDWNDKRHTMLR